jgi:hypothetical protein
VRRALCAKAEFGALTSHQQSWGDPGRRRRIARYVTPQAECEELGELASFAFTNTWGCYALSVVLGNGVIDRCEWVAFGELASLQGVRTDRGGHPILWPAPDGDVGNGLSAGRSLRSWCLRELASRWEWQEARILAGRSTRGRCAGVSGTLAS